MSRLDRIINWFRKPPQKEWPEYPREPAPPGGPADPEPPPPPPPPPPFRRGGRPGKAAAPTRSERATTSARTTASRPLAFFKSCLGQLVTVVVVLVVVGIIITIQNAADRRPGTSGTTPPPSCVALPQEPVEAGWRVMGDRWPRARFEVPPESFDFRPELKTGLDPMQYKDYLSRTECLNIYTDACTEAPLGGGSVGLMSYSGTLRERGISAAAEEIATEITRGAPVPRPAYQTRKSWGNLVVASSSVEFETPTPQRSCRAPRVRITVAEMELRDDRTAYLLITSLQGIDNAMTPELEERIMLSMRPR